MFNTKTNRNRSGQFSHADREAMTAEQRKEHQQATSELMKRNAETPMSFDIHCQPPSFADLAAREGAKAIVAIQKGNAFNAALYAKEAFRLARLEAK